MSTQLTVETLERIPLEELDLRVEIFATLAAEASDFETPEAFVNSILHSTAVLKTVALERRHTSARLRNLFPYLFNRFLAFRIPVTAPATGIDSPQSSRTYSQTNRR